MNGSLWFSKYQQLRRHWTNILEKLEAKPAWKLSSFRLKNDVIAEANRTGVKIHLGTLMSLCHVKNAQLGE